MAARGEAYFSFISVWKSLQIFLSELSGPLVILYQDCQAAIIR